MLVSFRAQRPQRFATAPCQSHHTHRCSTEATVAGESACGKKSGTQPSKLLRAFRARAGATPLGGEAFQPYVYAPPEDPSQLTQFQILGNESQLLQARARPSVPHGRGQRVPLPRSSPRGLRAPPPAGVPCAGRLRARRARGDVLHVGLHRRADAPGGRAVRRGVAPLLRRGRVAEHAREPRGRARLRGVPPARLRQGGAPGPGPPRRRHGLPAGLVPRLPRGRGGLRGRHPLPHRGLPR